MKVKKWVLETDTSISNINASTWVNEYLAMIAIENREKIAKERLEKLYKIINES